MNELLLLIDHLKTGLNSYDLIIITSLFYLFLTILHVIEIIFYEFLYLIKLNKKWLDNLVWFAPSYLHLRESFIELYNIIKLHFSIKSK